jgi:phosphoribosylaminoimidazolecarboxamide formyltransferase/IMP cyclohydrolase
MAGFELALVSVSDKNGVVDFCKKLQGAGVQILSTGGTARALREGGVAVTDVSEYTGSPEIMDGRVKTLHPRVHGGILMRDLQADREQLASIGGRPIDLVAVNLYPFQATVARGAPHDEIIENIDIGGPCLIRAAAKNHGRVTVVVDPSDYGEVADTAREGTSAAFRERLAVKAYAHTRDYDTAIAEYLSARG